MTITGELQFISSKIMTAINISPIVDGFFQACLKNHFYPLTIGLFFLYLLYGGVEILTQEEKIQRPLSLF